MKSEIVNQIIAKAISIIDVSLLSLYLASSLDILGGSTGYSSFCSSLTAAAPPLTYPSSD
jgi:hypothetical protein